MGTAPATRTMPLAKRMRRWFSPLDLMCIPAVVYLLFNNYIPMYGLVIAFKKIDFSKGLYGGPWVGLKNFVYLFKTPDAWLMTRNTILYNLAFILIMNFLGVAVGIILSEILAKRATKVYQTTILLPQLISIIIVANLVYGFLSLSSGVVNKTILPMLGLEAIDFYSSPVYWPFILTGVNIWGGIGYASLLYYASIIGIDRELYDAAYVDGASKFRQIRYITMPMLKPTVVMLVIMAVGRIFSSNFGLFYQVPMNSGPLIKVTQTIDTYVFRGLMQNNNIPMSSAAGAYQSVVGLVTVLLANYFVRLIDRDSALM